MRIWHKSLVRYLPDELLLQQWEDCREVAATGTHRVAHSHLFSFGVFVVDELTRRGIPLEGLLGFIIDCGTTTVVPFGELYSDSHDERYLAECWFELYEMHCMGALTDTDWDWIQEGVHAA